MLGLTEGEILGDVDGERLTLGEIDEDTLGDREGEKDGDREGEMEGEVDPAATYSSAPISHVPAPVGRVSPSMSSVNVAERSVPTLMRADPDGKWKSSLPAVTLIKLVVFMAIESKAVPVADVSSDAQVVCVPPEKSAVNDPPP